MNHAPPCPWIRQRRPPYRERRRRRHFSRRPRRRRARPSAITAIGKDVARPRIGYRRRGEQTRRPGAVPNVGLMRHDRDRQATRIGDDMALAALDLLARVIAASVGFTDRPSMTPAVAPASRPVASRASVTRRKSIAAHTPSSLHRATGGNIPEPSNRADSLAAAYAIGIRSRQCTKARRRLHPCPFPKADRETRPWE